MNLGCDQVGQIVEYRDIDEKRRLPRGGRSGIDVVGYVWRPWGIHIEIVRDRGSKGMDGCPLTILEIGES
jgi:hypothetical protein